MSKKYLNLLSSQVSSAVSSQEVATVGKTTVYVASQVGWNAAQQVTDPADLGAQTQAAGFREPRDCRQGGRWDPDCTLKPYTGAPDHLRPYPNLPLLIMSITPIWSHFRRGD